MWPDPQFPAHLVTFTEEIFNEIFIKMSLLYLKAKVVCPPKSLFVLYQINFSGRYNWSEKSPLPPLQL